MSRFTKQETLELLQRAGRYNLPSHPETVNQDWRNSCFYCGVMDAWSVTGDEVWLDAAKAWARGNEYSTSWRPNYGQDVLLDHFSVKGRLLWRYEDPEDYQNVHADHVLCGKIYMDLAKALPDEQIDLNPLLRVLDFCAGDEHDDYWWWADAVHMALPVFHLATKVTGKAYYAQKGHRLYLHAREQMQDPETMLWYRDWRFKPGAPEAKKNGKTFWSRGNGWVYAGLVNTLAILDKNDPCYEVYRQDVLAMTPMVLKTMGEDGFWRADLLEPEAYDMPETSGTLLFLTALMRGIRLGILDESLVAYFERGFEAVSRIALNSEGRLGYVQGVADRPGSTDAHNTHVYAVGCYFSACCEWLKWLDV